MSIPLPPRPCPECGQPITPQTIICPYCGSTVVADTPVWVPPNVDAQGVPRGTKNRRWLIFGGIVIANVAAFLLVLLGQWISSRSILTVGLQAGQNLSGILVASDFTLVPLLMGLIGAFFWRDQSLTTFEYFLYSTLTAILSLGSAFYFMGEGVICLIIVSPLLWVFVFGGSQVGRWLFGLGRNRLNLSLVPVALAILAFDALSPHHYTNCVSDRVLIHAPPSKVWPHLAQFTPIREKPKFWLFRAGLPYPVQSTVSGYAVGAERRCIFSRNLVFDERISEWQPGRKLTFDVVQQPRDPEILGHARVRRGQFVLQDNHDGTTTLIGSSWYELYVYPSWYYDLWAGRIAREVHLRVMTHIKQECEQGH